MHSVYFFNFFCIRTCYFVRAKCRFSSVNATGLLHASQVIRSNGVCPPWLYSVPPWSVEMIISQSSWAYVLRASIVWIISYPQLSAVLHPFTYSSFWLPKDLTHQRFCFHCFSLFSVNIENELYFYYIDSFVYFNIQNTKRTGDMCKTSCSVFIALQLQTVKASVLRLTNLPRFGKIKWLCRCCTPYSVSGVSRLQGGCPPNEICAGSSAG